MKYILAILTTLCFGILSAQSYRVGDLYTAPDGSQGIVYYVHPDGSGGWVVALNDDSDGCAWGDDSDVPDLTNMTTYSLQLFMSDTAGYLNTQLIRSYQNDDTNYAAGKVDFAHGWVLPSLAQLSTLYAQLPFITTALTNAGGTTLARAGYWCSAEQNDSYAYLVSFGSSIASMTESGFFSTGSKIYFSCHVRAVRSFSNTSITYDTALTYQWNTGSTQSYINVSPSQTTTYTVTGTTDYGCSTTAEQTVLVGLESAQTIYDTICEGAGYEANGFTLTAEETQTAGTLTRTRTMTTNGCSSNLTLQLLIRPTATSFHEDMAYRSYTWNGLTYYQSGDYVQHFNCANGCDSIAVLQLTILNQPIVPPPEISITASSSTVCVGDSAVLHAVIENAGLFTPPTAPPIAAGDILCTDGSVVKPMDFAASGKTAMGVVFFVDSTGIHGWAMALNDFGNYPWTTSPNDYFDVPTLDNIANSRDAIADFDGYGNTLKLRAAGDSTLLPAAWAVDFDHGWYLPAIGQWSQFYAQIVQMNASLLIAGGTPFPLDAPYFYWSSTENDSNNAWNLLYGGSVRMDYKAYVYPIREVRDF